MSNSKLQIQRDCFKLNNAGDGFEKYTWKTGCETAELIEKEGVLYQINGPIESTKELCDGKPGLNFLFPYEANFVVDFSIAEDNTPEG